MTLSESVFLSHIVDGITQDLRKCLEDLTDNMHEIRVDIGKIRGQGVGKAAFEMPESLDRWEKLLPDAVLPLHDVLDEFASLSDTIMRSAEGGDAFVPKKPKSKTKKRRYTQEAVVPENSSSSDGYGPTIVTFGHKLVHGHHWAITFSFFLFSICVFPLD